MRYTVILQRAPEKVLAKSERYRIRVGDYRVVYLIEDARLVVIVVRVGPRGDVYR